MAEDRYVSKELYYSEISHIAESLDQIQVDLREVKAVGLKVVEHEQRLMRLENGVVLTRQRNWKLWQLIVAVTCATGLLRLPELVAWLSKLKP